MSQESNNQPHDIQNEGNLKFEISITYSEYEKIVNANQTPRINYIDLKTKTWKGIIESAIGKFENVQQLKLNSTNAR